MTEIMLGSIVSRIKRNKDDIYEIISHKRNLDQ